VLHHWFNEAARELNENIREWRSNAKFDPLAGSRLAEQYRLRTLGQLPTAPQRHPVKAGASSSDLDPLELGSKEEQRLFVEHCQMAIKQLEEMQASLESPNELSLPCMKCGNAVPIGSQQAKCSRCGSVLGLASCSRCGELVPTLGNLPALCPVCGHSNAADLKPPTIAQLTGRIQIARSHLEELRGTYIRNLMHS
jgi:DNA-directed RNA polymerase subunit RPC12/RpoP